MPKIGVIGLGNRLSHVIKSLFTWDEGAKIVAVADKDTDAALARLASAGGCAGGVTAYADAEAMLDTEKLDGVMIGTRCDTHTRYALSVLARGLPLFLEKPVFTSNEDMLRLKAAMEAQRAPVVVSFPLRMTRIALAAKEIIDRGTLGEISQVQAVNNVNYGRGFYKKWYRDESVTGGLFLQKATHDLDLLRFLTGFEPEAVCALKSKRIFTGGMPVGQTCPACAEYRTCPESGASLRVYGEPEQPKTCSFAVDTGNEDAGSALLLYTNGVHASYAQNFVARKAAGKRLTRIIGFAATLEFDFVTGVLRVFDHRAERVDTIEFRQGEGHFGGDDGLTRAFLDVLQGKNTPHPDLYDGWISALTCLRARESSEERVFRAVAP